jgi:exodeoxyribonuclease VII small subunit
MTDERDTFESTRARLEEIAAQVRKKDTSLDQSIELLEESVRLANLCTEQVDQATVAAPTTMGADAAADVEPILASEVVTAEDVLRHPVEARSEADDFDLSDAWSEIDEADSSVEPAINDSQEVLELVDEEGPTDGSTDAAETERA